MNRRKHVLGTLEGLRRSGFTLVEMLVAVALVLLMMSMFTEVFSLATATMSRQKGLAENDQRARMVATLLGSDFRKRSFRDVVPFMSGMTALSQDSLDLKRGYLEYSENTPSDDTDDVLRLTIDTTRTAQDIGRNVSYDQSPELDIARDDFLLYGKTTEIGAGVGADPNQPEGDDGLFTTANGTGQSTSAEVVWFLRGGNLYRRSLLIRKPYRTDVPSTPLLAKYDATKDSNPVSATPIITGGYSSFWNNFDYSAFYNGSAGRVQFHVNESLFNRPPLALDYTMAVGALGSVPVSLGIPPFRFGHSPNTTAFAPREYDQSGAFIGSFTHEETSHSNFKYPGQPVTSGTDDPYTMSITLNPATNGITQFSNGPRIGEDMLLSNVVSFDIKIWDPGVGSGPDGQPGFKNVDDDADGTQDNASEYGGFYIGPTNDPKRGAITDDGAWVDLGHSNSNGLYYRASGNGNGSNTAYGNRFDTWHPIGGLGYPPYLPARFVLQGSALATTHPSRSIPLWTANNPYSAGTIVFPNPDVSGNHVQGFRFAYRCITAGTSNATEPIWNASEWNTTSELPTGPTWEAIPNLVPVRALQIKIRYLDVSSGLLKDLTLVESLCDSL